MNRSLEKFSLIFLKKYIDYYYYNLLKLREDKMKRTIPFIIFIWAAMTLLMTSAISAADITAGATTWYCWWDMKEEGSSKKELDPVFLYGPVMSVKLSDDFNISFVFLYGKFDMTEGDNNTTRKLTRTDSDLALNYRLNNYFKIFVGGKYMGYKQSGFEHSGYGTGTGVSFVFPLWDNFFALGNMSGLYLWGKEKKDSSINSGISANDKYHEYGTNSSLSLAYYIAPASVTLSLGGRYQFFKTKYEDTNSTDSTNTVIKHHFYGFTGAATYTFSI